MCRLLVKVSEQVIFRLLISSELDSLYHCIVYCLIKSYRQQLILYPGQNLVVSFLLIGSKKYLYLCLFNAPPPYLVQILCIVFILQLLDDIDIWFLYQASQGYKSDLWRTSTSSIYVRTKL